MQRKGGRPPGWVGGACGPEAATRGKGADGAGVGAGQGRGGMGGGVRRRGVAWGLTAGAGRQSQRGFPLDHHFAFLFFGALSSALLALSLLLDPSVQHRYGARPAAAVPAAL
jgi:hypothetical protein